jgi:hypothetical protein
LIAASPRIKPRLLSVLLLLLLLLLQAKMLTLSQAKRIKLTVDIQVGKLLAIKPHKEVLNDSNVFTHDKSTFIS